MEWFIAIQSKHGIIDPQMENRVRKIARVSIAPQLDEFTEQVTYSLSKKTVLFAYTSTTFPFATERETNHQAHQRYAIATTGVVYPLSAFDYHSSGIHKGNLAQLGGCFSLIVLDRNTDRIAAYTDHARLELVFYSQKDEYCFMGSKALMLHLVTSNQKRPALDLTLLTSFLHRGFWTYPGAPFKGVCETPPHSEIELTCGCFVISPIDNSASRYFSKDLTEADIDQITHTLLDTCARMKSICGSAKIDLTGGKDSRMVFLALLKSGVDFSTQTRGYENTPDVIVAKRMAALYDVEHDTLPDGYPGQRYRVDLLKRAQTMAFISDCMLYAFEDVGLDEREWLLSDYCVFNGLGGELYRGGFAKRLHRFTPKEVSGRIRRLYFPASEFFLPEVDLAYETAIQHMLSDHSMEAPETMEWIYANERLGKWAGRMMHCMNHVRPQLAPLCDVRLIEKVLTFQTTDKVHDHLIFEIIRRLDDRMLDFPLANDRWAFERNGAIDGDECGYQKRTPIVSSAPLGVFNWRFTSLADMRDKMREVIFDSACSEIFSFLDRSKIENLFANADHFRTAQPFLRVFIWYVYSACVMLEGSWYPHSRRRSRGFSRAARTRPSIVIPHA